MRFGDLREQARSTSLAFGPSPTRNSEMPPLLKTGERSDNVKGPGGGRPSSSAIKEGPHPPRTPRLSTQVRRETSRADAPVFSRFSLCGNCGSIMTSFFEVRTLEQPRRMEYVKPEPACLNSCVDSRSSLPH